MIKRALIIIAAALMLSALFCASALAKSSELGLIQGNEVNMRELPDTNSGILEKLPQGIEVEVMDETDGWYRVIYNGRTGYIRNDLVFVKSIKDKIAYVEQDGINLRGGPSQSAYIVSKITAGNPIRIKQMVGQWYYALYDGKMGFIHKDVCTMTRATGTGYVLLKLGMEGQEVKKLQNELAKRNFMASKNVTGSFGSITRDALVEFQKAAKITPADGVGGPETLKALYDPNNKTRKVLISTGSGGKVTASDVKGRVLLVDWWKDGKNVLKRSGGTAKLIDVRTGKSFNIRRYAGSSHADVTPMTANDTVIFKSIVGKWNWGRRSVWVSIGSKVYAGSINCMPHAPDHNKTDNFPGHMCLHFVNSKTHGGNRVDPAHQKAIMYAYNKGNNK